MESANSLNRLESPTIEPPTIIYRLPPDGLRITLITSLAGAIVVAVLRYIVRLRLNRRLLRDDYVLLFAVVCFVAYSILYLVGIDELYLTAGVLQGQQILPYHVPEIAKYLRLQFAISPLFWANLWAIKLAFLFMFQRFITVTKGSVHAWIHTLWLIVTGIVVCTFWVNIGLQLGSCQPISHFFVVGGCSSKQDVFMSNLSLRFGAASDIFTDVMIMIVPLILLRYIQINRKQKFGLAAVFLLGLFIISFAVLRIVMTNPAANQADPIILAFWTILESAVAVIVCSLPTFKSLLSSRSDGKFVGRRSLPNTRPMRRRRGIDNALETNVEDEDMDYSSTDMSRDGVNSPKSKDNVDPELGLSDPTYSIDDEDKAEDRAELPAVRSAESASNFHHSNTKGFKFGGTAEENQPAPAQQICRLTTASPSKRDVRSPTPPSSPRLAGRIDSIPTLPPFRAGPLAHTKTTSVSLPSALFCSESEAAASIAELPAATSTAQVTARHAGESGDPPFFVPVDMISIVQDVHIENAEAGPLDEHAPGR